MSLLSGKTCVILRLGYNIVGVILAVDWGSWLTYEDAFDVIGEVTFSKPLGFIEQGRDVDGIIMALEKMLDYSAMVSSWGVFVLTRRLMHSDRHRLVKCLG